MAPENTLIRTNAHRPTGMTSPDDVRPFQLKLHRDFLHRCDNAVHTQAVGVTIQWCDAPWSTIGNMVTQTNGAERLLQAAVDGGIEVCFANPGAIEGTTLHVFWHRRD